MRYRHLARCLRASARARPDILEVAFPESLRVIGDALTTRYKARDLHILKCKAFEVNTTHNPDVNEAKPHGTSSELGTTSHLCIQSGEITMLAGLIPSMNSLNLNHNLARPEGACARMRLRVRRMAAMSMRRVPQ